MDLDIDFSFIKLSNDTNEDRVEDYFQFFCMPGNMKLTANGNQSLLTVIVKAKKGAEKFKGKKRSFLKPLLARVKD